MATKCRDCGDSKWGTFTAAGVTHGDPICAHAATTGGSPDGLTRCARCGNVGRHLNYYCEACQWWAT
jgi:hypothetical protein